MYDDILFRNRHTLVGVPPNPGLSALRPVEPAWRRGFAAPCGRSFLHIRARKNGARSAPVARISGAYYGNKMLVHLRTFTVYTRFYFIRDFTNSQATADTYEKLKLILREILS